MQRGDEARKQFAAWLREVHRAAGMPSAAELERASARNPAVGGRALSKSGVHRLLQGEFVRPPDWDAVTAVLDACVRCAPPSDPVSRSLVDRELWRNRHQQLVTLLEAAREEGRDDDPGDACEDERDAADQALATYARRVRETYGRLDLEILTPDSDQSTQPSVELREVFVVPTVRANPPQVELSRELMSKLLKGNELSPDSELPPGLDLELLDSLMESYRRQPAEHVLDVLAREDSRRIVLLGDPGAGKSTLAHYLALTLTGGPRPHGPLASLADRIPLIVELRHYAQPTWRQQTFAEFLAHLWTAEGLGLPLSVLGRLLDEGRVLLVFDGLDEIFDPKFRAETARRIAGFAAHHEHCRVIVTSRVIGYQRQTLDGAGFAHYMIQDLDTLRIHEFARRWYETACPGQPALTEQLLTRLKEAVAHSRSVRELAGNPLLLTILAIIGRRQTLPRDRHGVYQHAVTVLVARWDRDAKHLTAPLSGPVAEALDLLGQTERLEMLRLLARRMQEGSGGISGNYVPETDIEDVFRQYLQLCDVRPDVARRAARAMVQQLRERNFILARYGGGAWGFVHRTFLEYLAAADIVHRYEHEREWTPEALVSEVLVPRAEDTTWHEVILLLAGQLREHDTGTLVDSLIRPAPFTNREERLALALRTLAEVKKIGALSTQSIAVVDGITQSLNTRAENRAYFLTTAHLAAESVTLSLASFGENWVGRNRYLTWFHVWGQFIESRLPAQLAGALHRDFPAVIAYARFAHSASARAGALAVLGERWPANATVTETIKTSAVHDEVIVRIAALQALSARPVEHERAAELRLFLQARAVGDPTPGARKEALISLARRHPDDETVCFLRRREQEDVFDAVRDTAAKLRAQLLSGKAGGGSYLRSTPSHPADASRGNAVPRPESVVGAAMAAWRSHSYGKLDELLQRPGMMSGQETLTSWLRRHPEDLRMLMHDALRLASRNAETALRAIGHSLGTEARDFLVDYSRTYRGLRWLAMMLLGETWGGDPTATAAFLESVEHGQDLKLRPEALGWLTENCAHLPEVRELLYRCASTDPDPAVRGHALHWMARWWPDHPEYASLFVITDPRAADAPEPRRRAVMLEALVAGGHEAEFERQLAQEEVLWIRDRMRQVERLRTDPGAAAPTVFHERLVTGLRRLLKARARAESAG
ncbi:NACHT domain-containing protein [Streptomyces sp. ME18-1-4]|uniref:NACHT domain-containing protein n=1 Tax=Streptomyces sp. ME18-1-4 TaxID=3028685 RepID=UPI0029B4F559|nr:NACHT domain-containing protein [Streptomyces sp. ME18-1-4]MDX3245411.1 NACHT domain-containing protein [Streptomyces sp. ME18-1-4]